MDNYLIKLKSAESDLNNIYFRRVPIGSLISKLFSIDYLRNTGTYKKRNIFISNIYPILQITYFCFRNSLIFSKSKIKKNEVYDLIDKKLLLCRSSNRNNLKLLIDPVFKYFGGEAVLFASGSFENNSNLKKYFKRHDSKTIFEIINFLVSQRNEIKKILSKYNLKIKLAELLHLLFIQLLLYSKWDSIFKNTSFSFLLVDSDRDIQNPPIVLAARNNSIRSATLVHGVINPPYGFVPVLADEIWCWGQYQMNQLIDFKVPQEKICIVGNPIAVKYIAKTNFPSFKNNISIGFGLNPVEESINIKIINETLQQSQGVFSNYYIKLHPAMDKIRWQYILNDIFRESNNYKLFDFREIENKDFFKISDLIVVTNSSIGYEAVLNDVPIWVYRVSPGKSGNDGVMIDELKSPDISNRELLKCEINELVVNSDYLALLIKQQQDFLFKNYFFKYGDEATKTIIRKLKNTYN